MREAKTRSVYAFFDGNQPISQAIRTQKTCYAREMVEHESLKSLPKLLKSRPKSVKSRPKSLESRPKPVWTRCEPVRTGIKRLKACFE